MFKPSVFIDTFQESFRNKMFLFFFVVSSLVIGTIGLAMMIAIIGMFLALMATSTLFAQMLQKGSIELLLCRPVPRWRIITARFLGGATIMAFNAAYLIVGVW